ncbi:cytochrome P450 [Stenotrophomonas maltophilia]|nr:cytochrome P450 [Stenotrophomonas maltophilia]
MSNEGSAVAAERLAARVEREGPVLKLETGGIGVFCPELAGKVDKENSEHLFVVESLADLFRRHERVRWTEVRSLIAACSAELTGVDTLTALQSRMRQALDALCGHELDATPAVWKVMAHPLVPMVIGGLDSRGTAAIERALHLRYTTQVEQVIHRRHLLRNFFIGRGESRAIHAELKRRVRSGRSARDYAQSLLTLHERIGLDKVTYLVTVQLIAISGVPGMMAACLLLALQMHPQWRQRIEDEFAPLTDAEIHALPIARIPCTMRFLKEVMRLYSTPFNNRRVAACDLQVEGQSIAEGTVFELSSFIQHRSAKYWDDPLLFDPDRWLPERRKRTAGIYVPYGFPSRSCVGSAVGNAQLVLLCALLSREYRFTPSAEYRPEVRMEGFAIPAALHGTFSRRTSGS